MVPCVIATWPFGEGACRAALMRLESKASALDAVEAGANVTEDDAEVRSVGYGGLPNRDGAVELDAAIMDGVSHRCGAVSALVGVRRPISVARLVMERTRHSMLAGGNARRFALANGSEDADLLTDESRSSYLNWRQRNEAPAVAHFDPARPADVSHDTIGICAMDADGNLAAGCTTSGLAWKIPGRVGDSPIVGSGLYVDNEVGAAAATGDGDQILKVCLSYRVVMGMESGLEPQAACESAIRYLIRKRPDALDDGAACIALGKDGSWGAAATRTGFDPPGRSWIYVVGRQGQITTHEGPYVEAPGVPEPVAHRDD